MARINYTTLTKAIKDVLEKDPNVRSLGTTVEINRTALSVEYIPHVAIFERRRTPTPGQPLAAGTRTRYGIQWEIVATGYSADGFEDASEQRDELMGYVEVALMGNRNLGGALEDSSLMLGGGEFRGGPGEAGFISQITLTVTVEATATT